MWMEELLSFFQLWIVNSVKIKFEPIERRPRHSSSIKGQSDSYHIFHLLPFTDILWHQRSKKYITAHKGEQVGDVIFIRSITGLSFFSTFVICYTTGAFQQNIILLNLCKLYVQVIKIVGENYEKLSSNTHKRGDIWHLNMFVTQNVIPHFKYNSSDGKYVNLFPLCLTCMNNKCMTVRGVTWAFLNHIFMS